MKKASLFILSLLLIAGCTTGAWFEDMAPAAVGSDVEDGATDVDPNTASFSITFVKAVDVSTVTTSTFFLVEVGAVSSISKADFDSSVCDPSKAILGTVSCTSETQCTFTPSSPLDSGTQYAICVTNEIEYEDNNIYPGQTITFTTAEAKGEVVPEEEGEEEGEEVPTDDVAPTITSVTPTANATGVVVNTTVQAVFSEDMDSNSVTTTTFTLAAGGVPVTGTVSYDAGTKTATFTPSANLSSYTAYTAIVLSGVKDVAGNELGNDYTWSFTTSDIIAPSVSSVSPSSGTTNLALNTSINVVFSEDMDATTINTTNITVTGSIVGAISGTVSYNSGARTATFTPSSLLANLEAYTVTVSTGVKDASGNGLASSSSSSFTTKQYSASLLYQKYGGAAEDFFGISVAGAGDVDGDGRADFIVGTWAADPGGLVDAGSAFVYSGLNGSLLYQKDGGAAGDIFGISVAGAGYVDVDETPDFIVGAGLSWLCSPPGQNLCVSVTGHAYVYSGADGGLLYQKDGAEVNDGFGGPVAGVGDLNGDGKNDFIVGGWAAPTAGLKNGNDIATAGRVYVYSGANGNLLTQVNNDGMIGGGAANDLFGISVAGAGYVNDDETPDFIVGAPGVDTGGADIGSAYVYSGLNGSLLYQKYGGAANDNFGLSVAGAGDVNGDGKDDFIVGAFNADPGDLANAGSVYVYSGLNGNLLYQKDGEAAGDNFGVSVAGAGDVNGDGRDDFIVGAWGTNSWIGSAYVYSGRDGSLLSQVNGEVDYEAETPAFGVSVAGAGDVNGDGKDDFIVGAFYKGLLADDYTGRAYIYISQ